MLTHWKTIQNYVGCNSVEELQKYLNAVYAVPLPFDSRSKCPSSTIRHSIQYCSQSYSTFFK